METPSQVCRTNTSFVSVPERRIRTPVQVVKITALVFGLDRHVNCTGDESCPE